MATEDKNTRLKSNMQIYPGSVGLVPVAVLSALEGDVDIKTIIFAALAVFIFMRLPSVLGQRTGSERLLIRHSVIAAVLCALLYVANQTDWYSALQAAVTLVTSISGLARAVDGDTVVVGAILAMALLFGAALVLSFLQWGHVFFPDKGKLRIEDAIRIHKARLDKEFKARVDAEVRRRIATADDHVRKRLAEAEKQLGEKAAFTKKQFDDLCMCVHPDSPASVETRNRVTQFLTENKARLVKLPEPRKAKASGRS